MSTPHGYASKTGDMAIDVHLNGPAAAGASVRLSVPELGLTISGRTDARGDWKASVAPPRRLVRWSPEQPRLCDVVVEAGADRWRDRVGLRTVAARGRDILLNGKPVFLRGISIHEEEFGTAPTREITSAAARALLTELFIMPFATMREGPPWHAILL